MADRDYMNSDVALKKRLIYCSILFIIFALIFRIYYSQVRWFNVNEFEHLHASWLVYKGQMPYRDFFEHHTPLLWVIFAPLFRLFGQGLSILFIARFIMLINAGLIFWTVYKITQLLYNDRFVSILSVLLLNYMIVFLDNTIQIGPDPFALLLWLVGLYCFVKGSFLKRSNLFIIISGTMLGMAFLFTQKGFFFLIATLTAQLAFSVGENKTGNFLKRPSVRKILFIFISFTIPIAVCLFYFHLNNSLREFLNLNLCLNLNSKWPKRFLPIAFLGKSIAQNAFFWIAGFYMAGVTAYKLIKRGDVFNIHLPFLASICTFAGSLFIMPTPWPHAFLPLIVTIVPYSAYASKRLIENFFYRKDLVFYTLFIFFVLTSLFIPIEEKYRKSTRWTNAGQLITIRSLLSMTSDDDSVFDGIGMHLFRPDGAYLWFNPDGLIETLMRRDIPLPITEKQADVIQSLYENKCKMIVLNGRIAAIPGLKDFLSDNYVLRKNNIYLIRRR